MSNETPSRVNPKPRGRPAKYRTAEERQTVRRAQVREATRVWRDNQHAADKVAQYALQDAGTMIARVLQHMQQLAERVSQQPERYPHGFDALLQVYASEARSAASHLAYVLQRQDKPAPGTD